MSHESFVVVVVIDLLKLAIKSAFEARIIGLKEFNTQVFFFFNAFSTLAVN